MNAPDKTVETCDYCGLPLSQPWQLAWPWRRTTAAVDSDAASRELTPPVVQADGPQYCCYGCRFAASVTGDAEGAELNVGVLARLGMAVFLTLNVMVFTMVLWSAEVYTDLPRDDAPVAAMDDVCRWLGMLFSLPVLWLLGRPLAENAWESILRRRPSTDVLLLTGVVAAYVASCVAVLRGTGRVYFEVGCVVLVMVTLGRWLEATGRQRATAALDALASLLPSRVMVMHEGSPLEIPLDQLNVDQLLLVRAGERIAADGRIVRGCAAIDQQILTGEHQPLVKEVGDIVFGGTLNVDGDLTVCVTAAAHAGALQRLIEAVQRARAEKGHYQRLAERVSAWFLPAVAAIAIATFVVHLTWGDLESAWQSGLAVVLIACPCALGLATPMAVWSALGTAAGVQVLFARGDALERLSSVRSVCFDKTGTLTTGQATLATVTAATAWDLERIKHQLRTLTGKSNHTLARTLDHWLHDDAAGSCAIDDHADAEVRTLPGRGIQSRSPSTGQTIVLGSPRWMNELNLHWPANLAAQLAEQLQQGRSIACLGIDRQVVALFSFDELLRPEAVEAIRQCQALGLHVEVLTGDHRERGAALARQLGVPVAVELLPDDKTKLIRHIHTQRGSVVMVGDGINDAPALAAADVGIALACGADVARQSADVCLLGDDLQRVPWAIEWSRRAVRVIRQNLFWAFFYNGLGILLAASGYLNPIWAAAAMVVSSVMVIGNSLRLRSSAESPSQPAFDRERLRASWPAPTSPAPLEVAT